MNTKKDLRALVKRVFPEYRGRKIRQDFSGRVTFYDTNWDGGTKNTYTALRLSDGELFAGRDFAPWSNPVEGKTVEIPGGVAILQRSIMQGREAGVTIYYGQLITNSPNPGE